MYADRITGSMKRAISEVERRREVQLSYNNKHNIIPQQITKPIRERLITDDIEESDKKTKDKYQDIDYKQLPPKEINKEIKKLQKEMFYEAEILNFEKAAVLRDRVKKLKSLL